MEYVEKYIRKLEYAIIEKDDTIQRLSNEINDAKLEIRNIRKSDCIHKNIILTHSTSGLSVCQSIKCKDCKLILACQPNITLFPPKEADVINANGN